MHYKRIIYHEPCEICMAVIEALEQEFGMEIFTRSGRGAALTEAGTRLLEYAERLLSQEAS